MLQGLKNKNEERLQVQYYLEKAGSCW